MAAAAVDRARGTVTEVVQETMRILPNGLIAASGFYALFTASKPYAVFFLAMLESSLIHKLLNWGTSYLSISSPNLNREAFTDKCRTQFGSRADFAGISELFQENIVRGAFPSYPFFMLTVASTYMFMSLNKLSKELSALGPAFASRYYASMVFLGLLSLTFLAFRLYTGCDNFLTLAMTFIVAFIVGITLVELNQALFGTEAINMIGIPLLKNRTANGQPIYVCPK